MKELPNKEKIKKLIVVGIPIIVLAIIQMVYNYLRFDNILEFGAKYQLTFFNIQERMNITFSKSLTGIVHYLFNAPNIDIFTFPFITMTGDVVSTDLNEFYYANKIIGLVYLPILWVFLFKKNIYNKDKELKWIVNISLISAIALMVINLCMGGVVEYYATDFKCILSLCAIILLLKLVELKQYSKHINKLFVILCIFTIIFMLPINLTSDRHWLVNLSRPITIFLKNTFEFWA